MYTTLTNNKISGYKSVTIHMTRDEALSVIKNLTTQLLDRASGIDKKDYHCDDDDTYVFFSVEN